LYDSKPSTHWIIEWQSPYSASMFSIKKILFSGRTEYQEVIVAELREYGISLILDGKIQSSERDEFIYHEMLVHPALITHPNPERVLLIGGGEGATLREILKHSTVKEVVMVDIDEEVVDICKKYLGSFHRGSFNDPRAKLIIDDGREFLRREKGGWDVIVLDVTDPIEEGPSKLLYTKEFYELASSKLKEDGILVTQSTSLTQNMDAFATIFRTLRKVFPIVRATRAFVPVYTADWSFTIASKKHDPQAVESEEAGKRVNERGIGDLKYYDPSFHPYYFHLPKFVREYINKSDKIALDKAPAFIY